MSQLTVNFNLSEFIRPGVAVPTEALNNLKLLAQRLQVIRDYYNKPITITSGYRTPAHNQAVGGARHSQHLQGTAADFVVHGVSAKQVQQDFKHWAGGLGQGSNFTHIDIRPYKSRWTYT